MADRDVSINQSSRRSHLRWVFLWLFKLARCPIFGNIVVAGASIAAIYITINAEWSTRRQELRLDDYRRTLDAEFTTCNRGAELAGRLAALINLAVKLQYGLKNDDGSDLKFAHARTKYEAVSADLDEARVSYSQFYFASAAVFSIERGGLSDIGLGQGMSTHVSSDESCGKMQTLLLCVKARKKNVKDNIEMLYNNINRMPRVSSLQINDADGVRLQAEELSSACVKLGQSHLALINSLDDGVNILRTLESSLRGDSSSNPGN